MENRFVSQRPAPAGLLGLLTLVAALGGACSDDDPEGKSPQLEAGAAAGSGDAGSGGKAGGAGGAGGAAVDGGGSRVKVEDGELEGTVVDGKFRSFLGIPYAKPPVGALRWAAPERPEPWTSPRAATEYGGRCAQLASATLMNAGSENEDCLYLNVWTPLPAPSTKLPVMVWIHGGANVNGSASEPVPYLNSGFFYTGEFLAQRGVVVVSLNYRLGVLGFLAHPSLPAGSAGNQGLWDQQFALSWVKRNIASFGGDPENVTIFGESAGSQDVCFHVASPKSRGLFHRAISESGGCTTFLNTAQTGMSSAMQLAAALGCSGEDTLGCLRGKSPNELLNALPSSPGSQTFGPVVDGQFLPEQPRALFDRGEIAKVPYILGSNTDEGTLFVAALSNINSDAAYRSALMMRYPTLVDPILERYPPSDYMSAPNPHLAAFARVFGDSALVCTTWDTALRAAKAGSSVYLYNFDISTNLGNLGVTHGAELVYVFGTSPSLSDDQKKVSEQIMGYWTNLAKSGDPNAAPLPSWPKFSESNDVRMNFALELSLVNDFRRRECEFWRTAYDERFAGM